MKNFRQVNWCLAPGAGARFASFPIRGSQRCLAPGAGTRFARIAKVPGTWVSPRVGMLAKELGFWWEKPANLGLREAFGGPGSSCGLSDQKSQNFFDFPGFVEVLVLD